mgnify:CR=1 FL=1
MILPMPLAVKPDIGEKIVEVAMRYLELYETKSNAEWDNPYTEEHDLAADQLKRGLIESGWKESWPYCASFCEMVWRLAYREAQAPIALIEQVTVNLTPSVMKSFGNWNDSITRDPERGAIAFWQRGNGPYGHAGIVTLPGSLAFSSIEANTSADANADDHAQREGQGIFRRRRMLDFRYRDGLHLIGFLPPPRW